MQAEGAIFKEIIELQYISFTDKVLLKSCIDVIIEVYKVIKAIVLVTSRKKTVNAVLALWQIILHTQMCRCLIISMCTL